MGEELVKSILLGVEQCKPSSLLWSSYKLVYLCETSKDKRASDILKKDYAITEILQSHLVLGRH